MRAVVLHSPKDLRIEDRPPGSPGPGEVRVEIKAGGICGSDLHYYNHGGTAAIRLREPIILGHEVAGVIDGLGEGVVDLAIGSTVAVNPSVPCGKCEYCGVGLQNHCTDMRFMGSAMRMPHEQGAFRQSLIVRADQAVAVAQGTSHASAAMAEPLAVCLHAAKVAGSLLGRRVLITGAGPIGVLMTMCAKLGGAREIVVTDLEPFPLGIARACGATRTIDVRTEPDALAIYGKIKGHFDTCFEASGSQIALQQALPLMAPGGTIVQIGLGGEFTLPINALITREIRLLGTFRFREEFRLAVDLIGRGVVDVTPLITASLPFADAGHAFDLANRRDQSMKVQLHF